MFPPVAGKERLATCLALMVVAERNNCFLTSFVSPK